MASRSLRGLLGLVTALLTTSAFAQTSEENTARWGLWGGGTVKEGHVLWADVGVGSDVNGILNAQVGYAAAIGQHFDLAVAVQGNAGVGDFGLALELPIQLNAYLDSHPSALVFGAEPGLMMSNFFGRHFELFYGVMYRLFTASNVVEQGPGARLGLSVPFRHFTLFVVGHASCLFVPSSAPLPTLGAELGFAFRFGNP